MKPPKVTDIDQAEGTNCRPLNRQATKRGKVWVFGDPRALAANHITAIGRIIVAGGEAVDGIQAPNFAWASGARNSTASTVPSCWRLDAHRRALAASAGNQPLPSDSATPKGGAGGDCPAARPWRSLVIGV